MHPSWTSSHHSQPSVGTLVGTVHSLRVGSVPFSRKWDIIWWDSSGRACDCWIRMAASLGL